MNGEISGRFGSFLDVRGISSWYFGKIICRILDFAGYERMSEFHHIIPMGLLFKQIGQDSDIEYQANTLFRNLRLAKTIGTINTRFIFRWLRVQYLNEELTASRRFIGIPKNTNVSIALSSFIGIYIYVPIIDLLCIHS